MISCLALRSWLFTFTCSSATPYLSLSCSKGPMGATSHAAVIAQLSVRAAGPSSLSPGGKFSDVLCFNLKKKLGAESFNQFETRVTGSVPYAGAVRYMRRGSVSVLRKGWGNILHLQGCTVSQSEQLPPWEPHTFMRHRSPLFRGNLEYLWLL
jgi:hypothetical protein